MTEKCMYCGKEVTRTQAQAGLAAKTMHGLYVHTGCIDSHRKENTMIRKCLYCDERLVDAEFETSLAIKIGRDHNAHIACIDSHESGKCVDETAQRILGAADSAHQAIDLARSLLQESLGNMGEILTSGCTGLGIASLGETMRMGQRLKEAAFLLGDLRGDAQGLCVLLGKDLGVCDDEVTALDPGPERPSDTGKYWRDMFGAAGVDFAESGTDDKRTLMRRVLDDDDDFPVGKDEYRDDEEPF